MWLRLETDGDWLRIEVEDARPAPPAAAHADRARGVRFGFVLVDALADKWGVYETANGKAVWAELDIHETW